MFGRSRNTPLSFQARMALAITQCDMIAESRFNHKPNEHDISGVAYNWTNDRSEYVTFKSRLALVFA